MTDIQTICSCVTACFTAGMTILGYAIRKRKQVDVTRIKITTVKVKTDKTEVEK